MSWPANSPDLNVIENIWSILNYVSEELDRIYEKRIKLPKNKKEMFTLVEYCWNKIIIKNLQTFTTFFCLVLKKLGRYVGQIYIKEQYFNIEK